MPEREGKSERVEMRNLGEIAQMLSEQLSYDEMADVVQAIEDVDFHQAVIAQWKKMKHPDLPIEMVD
jgi:hypothetical protein